MAFIKLEKSTIRGINLSSYHRLDFIRMIYKKTHTQPENLSSCHEMENNCVFLRNRYISEKICHLTLILQGGIAYFAIFSLRLGFSSKIARNEKESVTLSGLKKDLGFSDKSLISQNDLMPFHGMDHNRMFYNKSHNLNSDLMSSNCVVFIYYVLRKIECFMFQINVYSLCRV